MLFPTCWRAGTKAASLAAVISNAVHEGNGIYRSLTCTHTTRSQASSYTTEACTAQPGRQKPRGDPEDPSLLPIIIIIIITVCPSPATSCAARPPAAPGWPPAARRRTASSSAGSWSTADPHPRTFSAGNARPKTGISPSPAAQHQRTRKATPSHRQRPYWHQEVAPPPSPPPPPPTHLHEVPVSSGVLHVVGVGLLVRLHQTHAPVHVLSTAHTSMHACSQLSGCWAWSGSQGKKRVPLSLVVDPRDWAKGGHREALVAA
jgi:hypothetical protein